LQPSQPDDVHLSINVGVSTGYSNGGRLGATLFVYHPGGRWDAGTPDAHDFFDVCREGRIYNAYEVRAMEWLFSLAARTAIGEKVRRLFTIASTAVGDMSWLTRESRDWENRLNAQIQKALTA